MSGIHQACARAIANAWDAPTQPTGPTWIDEAAAAAVGVCLAEAQRAVEALPADYDSDWYGPQEEYVLRKKALAALAALAEEQA